MFAPNRLNSNNNNDDNDNDDDVFFNVFFSMKYFIPLQANFKRLFLIVSQPFFSFPFFANWRFLSSVLCIEKTPYPFIQWKGEQFILVQA